MPTLSRVALMVRLSISLIALALLSSEVQAQVDADRLSADESRDLKTMLDAVLKAKPGASPLNLADAAIKRQFDLTGRVAQYELLRLNKSMMEKRYSHNSDFVANYMARHGKLFEEKAKNTWLLAYATENKSERDFFESQLGKTGLHGDKRNTVVLSYYHLPRAVERVFYIELVSLSYKNGVADFSALPKRAKDWIANHTDLFP